jgi:hypothetical protein
MAPLPSDEVELLVHAAAPSGFQDDARYRAQASAYIESQDEWTRVSGVNEDDQSPTVNEVRSFTPVNKPSVMGAPSAATSAVASLGVGVAHSTRHSVWDSTTQREVQESLFDEGQNRGEPVPAFEISSNFSKALGETQYTWEAVAKPTVDEGRSVDHASKPQVGGGLATYIRHRSAVEATSPRSANKTKLGYRRNGVACGMSQTELSAGKCLLSTNEV